MLQRGKELELDVNKSVEGKAKESAPTPSMKVIFTRKLKKIHI